MKEKLCFAKYKKNGFIFCAIFLACLLLSLGLFDGMRILGLFFTLIVLCVSVYYFYAYFSYQKKAKGLTPNIGTISNWKLSGHKSFWGCVVLNVDGVEYCSPNYFSAYEAEEMVGKQVSYVIVEETLLIYDIYS
ncbi:MAG: hypothetical protein IJ403_07995 [Oscillospiraceae bacterium]|nr:hypothetical protein [Oscillospiraceae bacterium]